MENPIKAIENNIKSIVQISHDMIIDNQMLKIQLKKLIDYHTEYQPQLNGMFELIEESEEILNNLNNQ